jgi:hypothetical protein
LRVRAQGAFWGERRCRIDEIEQAFEHAIAGSASTSGASMAARSADRSPAKGGHPLIVDQAGAALQPFYLGINCG